MPAMASQGSTPFVTNPRGIIQHIPAGPDAEMKPDGHRLRDRRLKHQADERLARVERLYKTFAYTSMAFSVISILSSYTLSSLSAILIVAGGALGIAILFLILAFVYFIKYKRLKGEADSAA